MTLGDDASLYAKTPGGAELVRWFGQVPNFECAEILTLVLNREGSSQLRLHAGVDLGRTDLRGGRVFDRHAVVTFTLDGIIDLQLDGFGIHNMIGGLVLRRARACPDRRDCLSLDPGPHDIEIALEPRHGLNGLIRARAVGITFRPGLPDERDA